MENVENYIKQCYTPIPCLTAYVCFIAVLIQKKFLYHLGEQVLKKMKVFDISVKIN